MAIGRCPAGSAGGLRYVAKPCFPTDSGGWGIGLRDGGFRPGGRSDHRPLALNSYLPPLAPGRYHAAALARKMVLRDFAFGSTTYVYADPPQYAVSDAVEIDVSAATADWVRQTIARSVATLNGSQPRGTADYQAQQDAAEQLAFLDDPAAWTASLDLLPKEENVLLAGLARGRPPARICDLMQARVSAPTQSVSSSYLYRMTEICARANLPPAPLPPAGSSRPAAWWGFSRLRPCRRTRPSRRSIPPCRPGPSGTAPIRKT